MLSTTDVVVIYFSLLRHFLTDSSAKNAALVSVSKFAVCSLLVPIIRYFHGFWGYLNGKTNVSG